MLQLSFLIWKFWQVLIPMLPVSQLPLPALHSAHQRLNLPPLCAVTQTFSGLWLGWSVRKIFFSLIAGVTPPFVLAWIRLHSFSSNSVLFIRPLRMSILFSLKLVPALPVKLLSVKKRWIAVLQNCVKAAISPLYMEKFISVRFSISVCWRHGGPRADAV